MGLKFGIHVMRGIPRLAVAGKMPIEGSKFNAADAANVGSTCVWCPDMYGVRADTPAGQDWYDSILRLYAQWGVDFVKIDDLSAPYSDKEIEALRKAIDHCGRKIVFSTSPGDTPVDKGSHVRHEANMWRVSRRFLGPLAVVEGAVRTSGRVDPASWAGPLAGRRHDSVGTIGDPLP